MLRNYPRNLIQFAGGKPMANHKDNRIEPELALITTNLDVNVSRLLPFVAEKVKSISSNAQHRWHGRPFVISIIA